MSTTVIGEQDWCTVILTHLCLIFGVFVGPEFYDLPVEGLSIGRVPFCMFDRYLIDVHVSFCKYG